MSEWDEHIQKFALKTKGQVYSGSKVMFFIVLLCRSVGNVGAKETSVINFHLKSGNFLACSTLSLLRFS